MMTSFVYFRRHGPCHLLNLRYREPTHNSKQNAYYRGIILSNKQPDNKGTDRFSLDVASVSLVPIGTWSNQDFEGVCI